MLIELDKYCKMRFSLPTSGLVQLRTDLSKVEQPTNPRPPTVGQTHIFADDHEAAARAGHVHDGREHLQLGRISALPIFQTHRYTHQSIVVCSSLRYTDKKDLQTINKRLEGIIENGNEKNHCKVLKQLEENLL